MSEDIKTLEQELEQTKAELEKQKTYAKQLEEEIVFLRKTYKRMLGV